MNKDQINFIRDDLEFAALQYARLKCFQCCREDKSEDAANLILCHTDAEDQMEFYHKKMAHHAVELLRALEGELPERKS